MSTEPPDSIRASLRGLGTSLDDVAPPVRIDELSQPVASRRSSGPSRRAVWSAAAAMIGVGTAGLWWQASTDGPSAVIETDDSGVDASVPAPTTSLPTSSDDAPDPAYSSESVDVSGGEPSLFNVLNGPDPWEAAVLVDIDAVIGASPAEAADLTIANELASRACYEAQGYDLPAFDERRLDTWFEHERTRWAETLAPWTTDGQARLRSEGWWFLEQDAPADPDPSPHALTPAPVECYPAASGVTYLGGTSVWSEDQLTSRLLDDPTAQRWAPFNRSIGALEGTEQAEEGLSTCMIAAGWIEWSRTSSTYNDIYFARGASAEELRLADDLVGCLTSTGAAEAFLVASAAHVDAFRAEFATELATIGREREEALAEARAILTDAGLDPLTRP